MYPKRIKKPHAFFFYLYHKKWPSNEDYDSPCTRHLYNTTYVMSYLSMSNNTQPKVRIFLPFVSVVMLIRYCD